MSRSSYVLAALALTVGLAGCLVEPSDSEVGTGPRYEIVQSDPDETIIEGYLDVGESLEFVSAPPPDTSNYTVTVTAGAAVGLGVATGAVQSNSESASGTATITGVSGGMYDVETTVTASEEPMPFRLVVRFQAAGPIPGIGTSP